MEPLQIINGQFIRGGSVILPEFGNAEQIKAIKELELQTTQLRDGMELYPDSTIIVTYTDQFKCFCGKRIFLEAESEYEDDYKCMSDIVRKCSCGKHTFKTYMDCGQLMVKEVEDAN